MTNNSPLKVKVFADGADKSCMLRMSKNPLISGFTTNPTLMRKAGVNNYYDFAKEVISEFSSYPLSFEVFTDDFDEMYQQAMQISSWGKNVYVKIPVCNSKGDSSYELIKALAKNGIKQNVTAILTMDQVYHVNDALMNQTASYISIFAGRIADTGIDPLPIMQETVKVLRAYPNQELIWASPREVLNIYQANQIGCHIITVTEDILGKLNLRGKNLDDYSRETVTMFYEDAIKAGFSLPSLVAVD